MQILEITKRRTPQQQRERQLKTQLDAARHAARVAPQSIPTTHNQQRQKLNQIP